MKNILIAVSILILLVLLFIGWQTVLRPYFPFLTKQGKVTVNGHDYSVEVVKTDADRQKGLSGRKSLGADKGMLFQFESPDYYAFWMKGMKFPIDIIFINDSKVVTVYKNVPNPSSDTETPPVYKATAPANTVLELNSGEADKSTIKEGDTLTISL